MLVDYLMDLDRQAIADVEPLIRPYVRRTPVIEVAAAQFVLPAGHLNFKLELLQHSGSFKTRGAFVNLLTREVPAAGVVAASGGNHGAAVAYAAQKLGRPARIYVPTVSSPAKISLIRSYGAQLVVQGDRYADALAAAEEWAAKSGALKIHAYDEPGALLGQGTVGLEWQQQAPALDTLLVAVGGGGLIGGIAAWYEGTVRIIGVEPAAAPTLSFALKAGKPVDAPAGGIAADSLAPASSCSRWRRSTSSAFCWWKTMPSAVRSKCSGMSCGSLPSLAARQHLRRSYAVSIAPRGKSASAYFSVEVTRPPWISSASSEVENVCFVH
jgi:threonine dehydratase